MKLARTDLKIVEALQQDGRATNKQIANQLDVSEETIRRHRQSLVNEAERIENCMVGVSVTCASSRGRAFLDRELYLPKE